MRQLLRDTDVYEAQLSDDSEDDSGKLYVYFLVYVISNTNHIILFMCRAERLIRKAIQLQSTWTEVPLRNLKT